MEIIHRIGFTRLDKAEERLDSLGVDYKKHELPGEAYTLSLDIKESDPHWPAVEELLRQTGRRSIYETIFAAEEILHAPWNRLKPIFEQGYPQPEDKWESATFTEVCSACGVVLDQKAPFRLKKEPRLGKQDFMSLYWIYSLFCTHKIAGVFQENGFQGFETWPPIVGRERVPSQVVTQLLCRQTTAPGLADEDKAQPQRCEVCHTTKYSYHSRGYMYYRSEALETDVDFQMTYEWFGSGGYAFREFLVSQRVARLIVEQAWQGVVLKPLMLI